MALDDYPMFVRFHKIFVQDFGPNGMHQFAAAVSQDIGRWAFARQGRIEVMKFIRKLGIKC